MSYPTDQVLVWLQSCLYLLNRRYAKQQSILQRHLSLLGGQTPISKQIALIQFHWNVMKMQTTFTQPKSMLINIKLTRSTQFIPWGKGSGSDRCTHGQYSYVRMYWHIRVSQYLPNSSSSFVSCGLPLSPNALFFEADMHSSTPPVQWREKFQREMFTWGHTHKIQTKTTKQHDINALPSASSCSVTCRLPLSPKPVLWETRTDSSTPSYAVHIKNWSFFETISRKKKRNPEALKSKAHCNVLRDDHVKNSDHRRHTSQKDNALCNLISSIFVPIT